MKFVSFITSFFLVLLFSTLSTQAQSSSSRGVKSLAGAELGIRSGVFYEQRLSRTFSLLGSAGYGVGSGMTFHSGFSYSGIRPLFCVAPRWYFNIAEGNTQNEGSYLAFEVSYSPEKGAFLLPENIHQREKWNFMTLLGYGYRYRLSDKLMLKGQAGLSLGYAELQEKQGLFGSDNWKSKNEIVFDLGLIYLFN